jgi:ribosomal protein S18 acetylase RimI-like enzyme
MSEDKMTQPNTTIEKSVKIKESNLLEILKFRPWLEQSLPYLKEKVTDGYLRNKAEKAPRGKLIQAVLENKTVGFVAWLEEISGDAYLWWLVVLPSYRGQGIGSLLLDAALKDIEENGYQRVWTKVKNDNHSVFSILLRRKFFVKGLMNEGEIPTVLLEKELSPNIVTVLKSEKDNLKT